MRASFPCCSSFILGLSGTGALLVLIVVLVTGGFAVAAGPLHLSAHRWTGPLAVAAVSWLAAALCGRARALHAAASVWDALGRAAASGAVVVACAAAGTGIAFGTYSASGADASGYVSQARLLSSGRLARDEPLARLVTWPDAARVMSPLGFKPGPGPGEIVPTYPPGFPATMAAARLIGGESAVFLVVPLLGALAVLGAFAVGARLHSREAGLAAAVLLATSPIFLFQLVQPMSDVPATAWWALALALALSPRRRAALGAGVASGLLFLTRPILLPLVLVLLTVVACCRPRDAFSRAARLRIGAFAAGLAPFLVVLLVLQWRLHGGPLVSGYGGFGELFSLLSVWPNAGAYGRRLLHGETAALALAAASLGIILATRRRSPPQSGPRIAPGLGVAALAFAAALVCYLPYAVFAEWSYLRFLLPAFPATHAAVGALLCGACLALPKPARGVVFLMALAAAGAVNVSRAIDEQAFNMWLYEGRYRDAGRYLEAALPSDAVLLAAQQSGSAQYYAGVPIVRWDLLSVDLDTALADLAALGRTPLLLIEDWEATDLRRRFPASAAARLDWPPRADVGSVTRVRLFDPADRRDGRPRTPIDRLR